MITLNGQNPSAEGGAPHAVHIDPTQVVTIVDMGNGTGITFRNGGSIVVEETPNKVLLMVEEATARKPPPRMYP